MLLTLDFETHKIVSGSALPPKPVGLAIKENDGPGKYYAWGHLDNNNCSSEEAKEIVNKFNTKDTHWIFHNAKFDLSVMQSHWNVSPVAIVEDTMVMAFLANPHAKSVALKTLAYKELEWPSIEQDDLTKWIVENVKKSTEKNAGAYISQAPGDLVGTYAIGDVDRTFALYNYYKGLIDE
jgi:DNA polymerase I-like protein with 3'-5' exonuclease and polymerase domains|tara:strand:- start:300 stop:839 length:540 start_codon:yes stop_codon:yes gene_type:complete